ncbi:hypothetical protein DSO57_1024088 [Entomophthora muscae]|uniref:Uncharacterized protein n=1 Tax=Entomophthora muscae TaxID=34485 RepID=A0ACC2TPS1_9FUNG|nr:hypothetical protein DSO57_1024088 [Entomophthora muscae]
MVSVLIGTLVTGLNPSVAIHHLGADGFLTDIISTQLFGVLYITLTGLINSMVPANSPWALLGKLFYYIVKLAPILWWALPSMPAGRPPTDLPKPTTGWLPDKDEGKPGKSNKQAKLSLPIFCLTKQ